MSQDSSEQSSPINAHIQLDESSGTDGYSLLPVLILCAKQEEILSCEQLQLATTATDVFNLVTEFFSYHNA
jgi:hypothetical protein